MGNNSCAVPKRFEGDGPLLSRRPGGTQCGRCGKPWCVAPRGTDASTLVPHPVWISQKRTRQVVGAALPDLLAWNHGADLAVSDGAVAHRIGALFASGDSYDPGHWSRLPVRGRCGSSLAYNSAPAAGGADRGAVLCAPAISLSGQSIAIHRSPMIAARLRALTPVSTGSGSQAKNALQCSV